MTLKRAVQIMYVVSFLMASAAALVAGLANINHHARIESERLQLESVRLAAELRQSSDDLTRFARTYVATGDPKYEQYYRDVLAIRNGQKARPEHYERIHWDFVTAGQPTNPGTRKVSLQELMRESGFTSEEFSKLREAQNNSDALVKTEEIALHAMKGLYDDGTGAFTRRGPVDQALAIRLMHDAAYHREKARIMRPIDEVMAMVDQRTASSLSTYNRRSGIYWRLIQALAGVFLVLLVLSYPMVRRRVFMPVSALQQQTESVATDLDHMATVAKQIARGDLEQSFSATATPLGSVAHDEVGELSRLHDAMIGRLQETGAAIATMTAEMTEANKALKNENAERRRAEMEAAEAQRRIRGAHAELLATLDVVPAALVIMNPDRSIRLQNKAAEHLLGTAPGSPQERRQYFERFSVRDRAGRPVALDDLAPVRALSGVEVVGEELEVARPDGRKATILVGAAPVRDEQGQITGAVSGFQDISRLRELDRIKDEFVAIVSHELRTPLTAILGSLQLLVAEDAVTDPDNRELLTVGLKSCERLVRIVNDMLDISKMEAGRLDLRRASLDVGALVQQAAEGVDAVAKEAGVMVVRNVDAGLAAVDGDRDRLTQALVNLLSNAIKFAPRGSAVTVSARDGGDVVELSVTDCGPGIAPADIGRLFQKFEQLDSSGTRRVGGTGLGLTITKAIVEEHGGAIRVDSTVGQGTTFTFTVPRQPVVRQPDLPVPNAHAVSAAASASRVLIVEEDSRKREELVRAFEAAGFMMLEASTFSDAIGQARRHHPDAILISLNVRDSNGDLAADTLGQDPEVAQIPVVITSSAQPEGGTDAALEQPVDASELVGRVERALLGRGHATVLVADDDEELRLVVRRTLERHGFHVIEAANGHDALSMATNEVVDLLVLDLKMPNLHGYDVIRALRKREATAQLPIVVLSGSVGARHSLESLILGANAFLAKPADPAALVREVRRLVGAGRPA
jgi:signal transduction histidine kinase/CheY-like chemotaxis protein